MKLTVIKKEEIDLMSWDRFILSDDTNGEFINTHRYLSYHPATRFEDVSCAIIDENNKEIRCIFPAVKEINSSSSVISHQGTSFAGPIFSIHTKTTEIIEYIKLLTKHYKEAGTKNFRSRLKPLPFWPKNSCREDLNWTFFHLGHVMKGLNLGNFIDLSEVATETSFLKMCSGKRRNQIKKSLSNELVFTEENYISAHSWAELTKNLQAKFNTNPTHSFPEITDLQVRFPDNIRSFYVHSGSEYAAMAVIYVYKNTFHTQYLDLNYKFSSEYAHLFLIYNLITYAIEHEFKGFSFGPSTEGWGSILNEGLYSYKRQYGGCGIVYPEYSINL